MAQQQSLFGPSIYDVQQQQMQQDRENAIAQAKLTPYQSIRAGMSMSGIQAGRSIAGLFGVEDPKLKEASARQELKNAISAQWDGQDPVEAYKIMAKEAARLGLTQEAISAAAQVKAAEESKTMGALKRGLLEAQTGQAVARGRQADAQALAAGKPKSSDLGALQAERNTLRTRMQNSTSPLEQEELRQQISEIDAAITMKTTREAKDKTPPSVGQDREAIAQEIYGKGFYELAPEQKALVNKKADERAERLKPSQNVTLPKNLKSVGEVRQQFTTNVKPYITAANAAEQAELMIDQASQGNFQGWRAAITQLAKSVGDSQISRAEIEAYGVDPSLVGSIVDRTSIFFSGTPSQDTIKGAKKIATLVKKVNQDRAKQEQGTFLELATQAEGYNPKTTPRFFELPFAPTKQEVQEGTTSSGTKYKLTIK